MAQLMNVSIYGSVIIGIVSLVRLLVGRRIPRKILVFMWEIGILRLLLPDKLHMEIGLWHGAALPSYLYVTAGTGENPWVSENLLKFIWLYVAVCMGGYFVFAYLWQKRKLKMAQPVSEDRIKAFREGRKEAGEISVMESIQIKTPMACGIYRPIIYLPIWEQDLGEESLNCILEHEYQHIKYGDNLRKCFMIAALCIHWFNPLAWLAWFYFNKDMELLCDVRVLQQLGVEKRALYANTLLEVCSEKHGGTLLTELGGGRLKERITFIMSPCRKSILNSLIAMFCLGLVIFSFSGAEEKEVMSRTDTATVLLQEEPIENTAVENDNVQTRTYDSPQGNYMEVEQNYHGDVVHGYGVEQQEEVFDAGENGMFKVIESDDGFSTVVTGKTVRKNFTTGEVIDN